MCLSETVVTAPFAAASGPRSLSRTFPPTAAPDRHHKAVALAQAPPRPETYRRPRLFHLRLLVT